MVKISSSLLALTLVTGSALAFSDEYERRSELEEREPSMWAHLAEGFAKKLGRHAVHHAVDSSNGNNNNQRRELQQAELFGRDLDLEELLEREYDLEAREPAFGRFSLLSGGRRAAQHHHDEGHMGGEHHPAGHRLMRAAPISSQVQDTASPLQGRGFEDVEARERGGRLGAVVGAAKVAQRLAVKHRAGHRLGQAMDIASAASQTVQNREFVDDEDMFERAYDLEARERGGRLGAVVGAAKVAQRLAVKHRAGHRLGQAMDIASAASQTVQNREFVDDEEVFGRDLDAEELFGRDDLEARERGGRLGAVVGAAKVAQRLAVKHRAGHRLGQAMDIASAASQTVQNREFIDDEEVFGRDLDAEELFGREYDLFDDLD